MPEFKTVCHMLTADLKTGPDIRDITPEQAWHDGNGHSHDQAALMGPSLSVPVREGEFVTGIWQQVVVINHDNGPRTRKIALTLTGMTP